MAINTVVSNDDLVIYGPPSSIELQLGIGATGQRGSIFFSGTGDPNSITFTETPQLNDLFIRNDIGGNYGTVYKYVSAPGGDEWQSVLDFQPINYNSVVNTTFTSGSAMITVLLDSFYQNAPSNLSADEIAIQLTPENDVPLVLSISDKSITLGENRNLIIELAGVEYNSPTWSAMSGSVNIGLNLSIIE